jgi:3-dehydroquinate synthase
VVTDDVVGPLYRRRIVPSLVAAGIRTSEHTVPAGERSKSWERAGALLEHFAASGLDRTSAVVALGGGVVGDLAGFCAATYMRGIPVVQVPTTLLAQVDSAIGGKTAVDLDAGKNLAGAFWPPALVVSDVAALETLPESEGGNGRVEVGKTALRAGEQPLADLENDLDRVLARDHAAVTRCVADAAAFKASIVSADERESGLRECLNLGHTLGHALESVAGYGAIPHGVAVAEGLRFAALLAEQIAGADPDLTRRTTALLARAGAPPLKARLDATALLAAMRADKKSRNGVVRFVLLAAPGSWSVHEIADATLESALGRWAARATGEVS